MTSTPVAAAAASPARSCSQSCRICTHCTCGETCQCTESLCLCASAEVLNCLGSNPHDFDNAASIASPPTKTSSCCSGEAPHSASCYKAILSIQGMHCQSCVKTITRALKASDFVVEDDKDAVLVDLENEEATVLILQKGDAEEAVEVIECVGFAASVLSVIHQDGRPRTSVEMTTTTPNRKNQASSLFSSPDPPKTDHLLQRNNLNVNPSLTSTLRSTDMTSRPMSKQVAELVVTGITCSMCTKAITAALQELSGVSSARVSLATNIATIEYDTEYLTVQHLVDAICQDAGYRVTEIILQDKQENQEDRLERLTRRQEEEAYSQKRAFVLSLVGTVPILFLTMILPSLLGGTNPIIKWLHSPIHVFGKVFGREALLLWGLATPVQFGSGWTFYRGTWYGLKTGKLGMDVLVAMGTTASYGYALSEMMFGGSTGEGSDASHFFETSATLICFVLLGKWMNALAVRRTSDAITKLLKLQSKTAVRVSPREQGNESAVVGGKWDPTVDTYDEETVSIDEVHSGDIVKVLRGSSVPADGIVVFGELSVDESMITGESLPVLKTQGSIVLGGTVCVEGPAAFCRVTGVGASTALSQIVKLVQDAQTAQVPIQNFADTIASIFVPTVATLSVITFLVWYALCNTGVVPNNWYEDLNESPETFSLMFAIACLVISCPCALGLATPTAVMVGTGVGAKHGILIKGGDSLEKAKNVSAVVFDKTGTLTKGKPCITDFCRIGILDETDSLANDNYFWWLLASLERNSEHPLAAAVVAYAEAHMDASYLESHPFVQPSKFLAQTGRGASGVINKNSMVAIGNRPYIASIVDADEISSVAEQIMAELEEEGKTAVLASVNGSIRCVIGIADEVKSDAAECISYLQNHMGLQVWMVTGDNSRTARAISKKLNLSPDHVISEALPVAKVRHVRKLQDDGHIVAMVGDGINDSPALAQSDVGISLGTGAEIAAEASDMVLVKGHVIQDVCTALDLSRVIFRRIQLNFLWSLLYNSSGIPVAAGVFFPLVQKRLPPTIAAVAMALSSLSVVGSSLALRFYRPPDVVAIVGNAATPIHNTNSSDGTDLPNHVISGMRSWRLKWLQFWHNLLVWLVSVPDDAHYDGEQDNNLEEGLLPHSVPEIGPTEKDHLMLESTEYI